MFIDIHNHCTLYPGVPLSPDGVTFITDAELLAKFDENQIEQGVLLPNCTIENVYSPQGTEEILQVCKNHPGRFIPFCNIDPRSGHNSCFANLEYPLKHFKELGLKGIGEITANLPFLDPRVQNLFACAQDLELSVTFHMSPVEGNNYGLVDDQGLPQLAESLRRFPRLKFFGHSQCFWAEMGPIQSMDDRFGYPNRPLNGNPGCLPQLFRDHPNLYGDLSACSALNALRRDPENAVAFLTEFQDRLFFGTDVCFPGNGMPLAPYLLDLRKTGAITETVFQKIARENAIRVLKL